MAALMSLEPDEHVPPRPGEVRRSSLFGQMSRRSRLVATLLGAMVFAGAASDALAAPTHVASSFPAAGVLTADAVVVRRQPSAGSAPIKRMAQFRPDYRRQEIFAVSERTGSDGKPWYRISVPMRPNGTMGWIPAESAELAPTANRIVVHRRSRTIDVYAHGRHALHAVVAIGAPGMETPVGRYYVQARFVPDDPFLGVFALETSAYSKLSEWPGGGVVGIHGTSMPQLLGQAVSHGCVRVSNATAAALRRLAPLGTPITISD
jgi:hypothetical protein